MSVHNTVDKALEPHQDPQRSAYTNHRSYLDDYPNVEKVEKVGYVPWRKGDKVRNTMPSPVQSIAGSIKSRREKKADQARLIKMEKTDEILEPPRKQY